MRSWPAMQYGRHAFMASRGWYGRLSGMASSKVWQVMWYGRHCGLAGSNVPYRVMGGTMVW